MVDTTETKNKFAVLGKTKLINGTITMPQGSGLRLVLVAASDSGKPDSDLYNLLDRKWKAAKMEAKGWHQMHTTFKMGAIKDTAVQSDVWLLHCLFLDKDNQVNEKALLACLKEVTKMALYERATVNVSTLLTTAFPQLQGLLDANLVAKGVSVNYYEEPITK